MINETADAVVVGAGINGAASAFFLVEKGVKDVVLIDRGPLASGPTGASSAIVRQHYGHEATARMALESLRFFQRFDEVTGGHAEFKTCGVVIAGPEESLGTVREVVEMQRRVGIRTEMIDLKQIQELEPDMWLDDLAGGAWEPDAGYADPVGSTAGFVEAAVRGGAKAHFNDPVTQIVCEGGRVVGVETGARRIATERVIVAAGPWTPAIARTVGTDLPIKSSRHPVLIFEHPSGRRPQHILFDLKQIMYLRPEGADMTLVGTLDMAHSQDESDPDNFDRQPTLDEISDWGAMLLNRYPEYTDVETRSGWCGIYEYSPDWHHIIDELPTAQGCWVVCGTSGHGFKLGPAVGNIVSDLVLGRPTTIPADDFRLDRFIAGHGIGNRYAKTIIG